MIVGPANRYRLKRLQYLFVVPHWRRRAGYIVERPRHETLTMDTAMKHPPSESDPLIERLRAGDRSALTGLFQVHRDRLRRMVELRIDARLRGRVDASDVLQDAFLSTAARRRRRWGSVRRPEPNGIAGRSSGSRRSWRPCREDWRASETC